MFNHKWLKPIEELKAPEDVGYLLYPEKSQSYVEEIRMELVDTLTGEITEAKNLLLAYRDNPPLCDAAAKGDKKRVEQLLKNGANPTRACRNAKSPNYPKNPLMIAAMVGNTEIMVELLACQQVRDTINQPNEVKKMALHYAIEHHHPGAVSLLLELGADPYPKNLAQEDTPFMVAATHGDLETIRCLLEDKRVQADPQAKKILLKKLIESKRVDIAESLIVPVDAGFLEQLLHFAVEQKDLLLTQFVLTKNFPVPPFLFLRAIDLNCMEIADLLKPINTEILTSSLCRAVQAGNLSHVKFLLEANASVNSDLLKQAIELGHANIAELLLKHGRGITSRYRNSLLHLAMEKTESVSLIEALSAVSVEDIHATNHHQESLLHLAVRIKNVDWIYRLLEKGANPNVTDDKGKTPLRLVIQASDWEPSQRKDAMDLLLSYGADNPFDSFRTPLMSVILSRAETRWSIETAKFLFENERTKVTTLATLNQPDKEGNTVLHYTVQTGDVEVVQILLEKGANPNIANSRGETPLTIAAAKSQSSGAYTQTLIRCTTCPLEQKNKDMAYISAAKRGNIDAQTNLLIAGADVSPIPGLWNLASRVHKSLEHIIFKNTGFWNRLWTWLFSKTPLLSSLELARCRMAEQSLLGLSLDLSKLKLPSVDQQHPYVARQLSLLKQYCEDLGLVDKSSEPMPMNMYQEEAVMVDRKHVVAEKETKKETKNSYPFWDARQPARDEPSQKVAPKIIYFDFPPI